MRSRLSRARPAIARQLDAPADEHHTFVLEASTLGEIAGGARCQRQRATGIDDPMPGQRGRTAMQRIAGLAGSARAPGISGQIAVRGNLAARNTRNQGVHGAREIVGGHQFDIALALLAGRLRIRLGNTLFDCCLVCS